MAVVFGILLVVAALRDRYHLQSKLPLKEREDLLFCDVAERGLIRRGCTFIIDAVFLPLFRWLRGCSTYICRCAGNSSETRPVTAGTAERVLQAIRQWALRALELLASARRSFKGLPYYVAHLVVHYSIGLLVAHRSAIDRDTAYILQTGVKKNQVPAGAAPSNAENAENANRGSRTTETSGRETVPGETPRQRTTHFEPESIHRFHAQQTSLTKASELNRRLGDCGADAATEFLAGNFLTRVLTRVELFPAVHGWFALSQFSIALSHVIRVALLSMKVFSGCAMEAALFSSTAEPGFNDEKPECSPARFSWKHVEKAVFNGFVSTLVSDVVIWILSYILSATIEERPSAWTPEDRSARLRWSRWRTCCRTCCFLFLAASYDLACLIYVYLFIANAREVDSMQLMLAIIWGLLLDGLWKPLAMAAFLAKGSSLALCLFPEISGEVRNKWPKPTEDASESRPATRPGPPSSQTPEGGPKSNPAGITGCRVPRLHCF